MSILVVTSMGARVAKRRTIDDHFTMVANHLTAVIAGYFASGGARQVKFAECDLHFVHPEEHTVWHSHPAGGL